MPDARHLCPQDTTLIDVPFIPAWLILPALIDVAGERAEIVVTASGSIALVKPQFEVGKEKLPTDSIVKRDADRQAVSWRLRAFIESDARQSVVG